MIILREISLRLAEAIKTSGKTQTEIGKELGISQQTVSHYIKGDIMPALDTFANLCVLLDLEPAEILGTNDFKSSDVKISNSFNNSSNINLKI